MLNARLVPHVSEKMMLTTCIEPIKSIIDKTALRDFFHRNRITTMMLLSLV